MCTRLHTCCSGAYPGSPQLDAETKASDEADGKAFDAKETALSDELNRLTKELETKRQSNKESEDGLRKKKVKYEGEVSGWITK